MRPHHSAKVLVFLGAGASRFAEYYTFADFPELLFNTELRNKERLPPLSQNSERILGAVRESLLRNNIPTTHDNFLWRLEGYNSFLRLNSRDDVLQDFLQGNNRLYDLSICTEQAIRQISATTIHHYSANRVEIAKISNPTVYRRMQDVFGLYYELACLNGTPPFLPIFTTNYDMLLEDLTAEFSDAATTAVRLVSGIPEASELSVWSSKLYESANGLAPALHLNRLHGCACWFYHDQGDGNIYFHRKGAASLSADKLCAMYPGRETQRGCDPHGHAFRKLYASLKKCELLLCIGFSFRDDDVMHVILKTLEERPGKFRILIIDALYTQTDVQHRLEDAAKRSQFPYRVPKANEIESLTLRFGENDSVSHVLDHAKRLLKKRKAP